MTGRGESNRNRNLAIAGGVSLGLGVAGVLAWQLWSRQRSGPEREYVPMVWDPNLGPGAVQIGLEQIADIDPLAGRRYKNYLAVLTADADPILERLGSSETARAAIAIQGRRTGDWHVGIVDNPWDRFGEMPDEPDRLAAAVHLGQPAIAGAVLAVVDEGVFTAYPTTTERVADITTVLHDYPHVPLLSNHPVQK